MSSYLANNRNVFGFIGILVFIFGMLLGLYNYYSYSQSLQAAISRDRVVTVNLPDWPQGPPVILPIPGPSPDSPIPRQFGIPCHLEAIDVPDRTIVVGDSFNVMASMINPTLDVKDTKEEFYIKAKECRIILNIIAAGFDVKPSEVREISLGKSGLNIIPVWNLGAKNVGTHEITIGTSLTKEPKIIVKGITVRDNKLLNRWQSLALSLVSALGGPILTVPWWIEFMSKRREAKSKKAA